MVTSWREKEVRSSCGVNVSSRYRLPFHKMPPSLKETLCSPHTVSPLAKKTAVQRKMDFLCIYYSYIYFGLFHHSLSLFRYFLIISCASSRGSPTSCRICRMSSVDIFSKSSLRGVTMMPAISRVPGLTSICLPASAL